MGKYSKIANIRTYEQARDAIDAGHIKSPAFCKDCGHPWQEHLPDESCPPDAQIIPLFKDRRP